MLVREVVEQVVGKLLSQPAPAPGPAVNPEMDRFVVEVSGDASDQEQRRHLSTACDQPKQRQQAASNGQAGTHRNRDFGFIPWSPMVSQMQLLDERQKCRRLGAVVQQEAMEQVLDKRPD